MAAQGSKKAAGLRGIFGASSSKDNLGSPNSRMRRVEQSISLSPAEREGTYTLNPGELKLGDLVELKAEYEKIQKTFAELPAELEELPKMNPCGKNFKTTCQSWKYFCRFGDCGECGGALECVPFELMHLRFF